MAVPVWLASVAKEHEAISANLVPSEVGEAQSLVQVARAQLSRAIGELRTLGAPCFSPSVASQLALGKHLQDSPIALLNAAGRSPVRGPTPAMGEE